MYSNYLTKLSVNWQIAFHRQTFGAENKPALLIGDGEQMTMLQFAKQELACEVIITDFITSLRTMDVIGVYYSTLYFLRSYYAIHFKYSINSVNRRYQP